MSGTRVARVVVDRVLDAAFPGRCVGCRREGPVLCPACAPALDARLGLPAGVPIGLPGDIPEPLLQLEWCAPFRGVIRDALHQLKYGGEQRLAGPLGAAVARRWARAGGAQAGGERAGDAGGRDGPDLVVNVPVHVDRLRVRGYDQAELIARAAALHLGMPFTACLMRGRATIAQFDLDRASRATNVAGAFTARAHARDGPSPIGRWVLLVDDVTTTGATLAACAEALHLAGAAAVSAITVARER